MPTSGQHIRTGLCPEKHCMLCLGDAVTLMCSAGQAGLAGSFAMGRHRAATIERASAVVPQVRIHEPCSALDGGDDRGTVSLDHICDGAVSMLGSGGFLALETAGGSQAHAVASFLAALDSPPADGTSASAGLSSARNKDHLRSADSRTPEAAFERIDVVTDMFGVDRFVIAWRT